MTQKTESVREAEQREIAEEMAHEAGLTHRGTDLPREDVVELMIDFAKSTTLRLAEDAQQKSELFAKENPLHDDHPFMWLAFAAWLREKAR